MYFKIGFLEIFQYLEENICVAGLLQHMYFLVNIAKFFDSKIPVASVYRLFLIKRDVGRFLLKKVDLVIVRVI